MLSIPFPIQLQQFVYRKEEPGELSCRCHIPAANRQPQQLPNMPWQLKRPKPKKF